MCLFPCDPGAEGSGQKMAVLWNHVILLIFGCFLEMGVGCQEFFRLIAFYRIVCEQMCLKFVVSLVCGVVCVFVACLLVLGGLWSSTCIVTLLRMRGPLDDAWLYVPGLCPLVMSVVSV